ncbi:VOC family protein [Phytohabitans sp. ZYX-F-186]|uniref:VOC family protein n=1 Tax=Phytohabitans maris TaxID=3071409 RepID=A0ABU0ZTG2_9ACTN|nr:VOC family protein [Phytohabitans sp. ZYX-F-186]MDQ7910309.1 VOC family protein [Phytohabitans sp. ZYX-F-186]
MSVHYQVTFSTADPHGLAAFYAEAIGYLVEDHSGLIKSLLEQGATTDDQVETVDGRLRWRKYAAIRDPDGPYDERSGTGRGGRMLFQDEPTPKTAKNRLHLDLHVGERRDEVIERLTALGARRLWEASTGPMSWVTLADPDGNELCVS